MRKLFLVLTVLVLFGWVTPGKVGAAKKSSEAGPDAGKASLTLTKGLSKEQREKNIESFETVWSTIRDFHYDPKLGGLDWQGVHKELKPRVEKAETMSEARNVLSEMLARLGHSHVAILPASLYDDNQGASAKVHHEGVPGFDVRMVGGEAVVVRVTEGLPAAKAGVRPGWLIRKINGDEVAPMLAAIRDEMKKAAYVPLEQALTVMGRLRGEAGKEVTVTFLNDGGNEVNLAIRRAVPQGNRVKLGQLPPFHVHFEARKMDNDIAYFYLSSFADPVRVMKAFSETVQDNAKAEGFILDLRGNFGGLVAMTQGLGGWFVDQPNQKLGTMSDRKMSTNLALNPREITFSGPLAILVDEFSMSSSEILAGGLQDLKRARVFGRKTIGAALPSTFLKLPNGDRLQYVIADYVSAGGKRLEANGVQPDESVTLNRQALLNGRDPDMDAAVQWILAQGKGAGKK